MGDLDLIEALQRGRNDAWTELVNRYLKLVYHVVRRTLATYSRQVTDQDVEDISGDLFQSLVADHYRVLRTIGPPHELKPWLTISAKRRAIDHARKRRMASISLDDPEKDLGIATRSEEESQGSETERAVWQAMKELNAKERTVVQLFYMGGKKYKEISRLTGINPNSISPTLTRAVEKIQKWLREKKLLTP